MLFQEKQKFTQWWLWLLLLGVTSVIIYSIIASGTSNSGTTENDDQFVQTLSERLIEFSWPMTFIILIITAICILFYVLKLETNITKEEIRLRYFPFLKKTFKWNDIATAEIMQYGFVGYGIRFSLNYGTVYNVKGNKGLFITLKNGKKYLIGTQKPEEMKKTIHNLLQ